MVHRFCTELKKLVENPVYTQHRIYHYTGLNPQKRANAAFLMGAYQVLVLNRTGVEAWSLFRHLPPFPSFRDASFGSCTYQCTILHCLRGLEISMKLGWFSLSTFDLETYEKSERVENGDMNWIIPGKFLAFSCPSPVATDEGGWRCFTPEDYVPVFKNMNVSAVVRLNKKTYEASRFTRLGIRHYDLYFLDGSVPSEAISLRFLEIGEKEPGVLAVHCKAGLGRTGTLIGLYAMKHYGFPPAEFIGWIRLCRPGSVLGPQQQFLVSMESQVQKWAKDYESELGSQSTSAVTEHKLSDLSPEDHVKACFGDKGQAERLVSAKKINQSPSSAKTSPKRLEGRSTPVPNRANSLGPLAAHKRKPSASSIFLGGKQVRVVSKKSITASNRVVHRSPFLK